ncbi:MAG: hypothetical protein LH473_09665 [Chitinophagales bacterium]|nr:hypothetical protein [Chitinophagales bacterium]
MKKVFLVLFASAALSFAGCESGNTNTPAADSTATQSMVQEAMDSVADMAKESIDSTADAATEQIDSLKK